MSNETLEIQKSNALIAYENATPKIKAALENLFGKNVFLKDIKDRVKTFENACEVLGIEIPVFTYDATDMDAKSTIAYRKLCIIARALNEGWKPDWTNSSEYKYIPWFKSSGPGFAFNDCGGWDALTTVGSRLCFKSRELAEYAGKQFIEIYNDYITF